MPSLVFLQNGIDAVDYSANKKNSDEFISANSTDSKYNTTENTILFLLKHLNDLTRDLCFSKEKAELLASWLKE